MKMPIYNQISRCFNIETDLKMICLEYHIRCFTCNKKHTVIWIMLIFDKNKS